MTTWMTPKRPLQKAKSNFSDAQGNMDETEGDYILKIPFLWKDNDRKCLKF